MFFALPFIGLIWRVPWGEAWDVLTTESVRTAFVLSMHCSLWATLLSLVFGVPLAWLLARVDFPRPRRSCAPCAHCRWCSRPWSAAWRCSSRSAGAGLFGQYLDRWFGVTLPFSTKGVVLAQTFVSMPFLILTMEAALRQLDRRFEDAARTLGGSRWYVFRRVTLPSVRPALVAGSVLAWARALGEFGATITFAGNFPGTTQTMPLATYLALESNPEEALILSLLLVAVSFAVLVGLRDRWLGGVVASGSR